MHTYNQKLKKLFKKTKPNSGFTLTELLVGLIMSILVTGALGFGLIQVMNLSRRGAAQANTRNEANRALEFISDELRRAQNIELSSNVATPGYLNVTGTPPAPGFTAVTGGTPTPRLALQMPGVEQRVIYYVTPPPSNSSWQGPLVLYRWGPNLNANGSYTDAADTSGWQNEALIDGLDNSNQTITCGGENFTYQGFFACIADDDGDGVTEDGATDTNGDGVVNADDSTDDVDDFGQTAELFLVGGVDTIAGNGSDVDDTVTASTQTVARAKEADVDNAAPVATASVAFRVIGAGFVCDPVSGTDWQMRMDFDNDPYASDPSDTATANKSINKAVPWIYEEGRQSQPIEVSQTDPMDLTIYSIPFGATGCLSSGNSTLLGDHDSNASTDDDTVTTDGDEYLSEYADNGFTLDYNIKFQETVAGRSDDSTFWTSFNGDTDNDHNNPNVTKDGKIIILKRGSRLVPGANIPFDETNDRPAVGDHPAPLYPGYDFNRDGNPDKKSLGRFLYDKGYAEPINSFDDSDPYADPTDGYRIKDGSDSPLGENERIVAMEIGQTDNGLRDDIPVTDQTFDTNGNRIPHPGFELQDTVLIVNHSGFEEEYEE